MTISTVTSSGHGKLAFRLVIEGLPYEFVSTAAMETTAADGRIRVRGLDRKGLVLEEAADIARAVVESSAMTVTIIDRPRDRVITKALAWDPEVSTLLSADLSRTATSATVFSTAGISAGDVVHIGTEAIEVGSVTPPFTLAGLTRGVRDTFAQAHYTADGAELAYPEITLDRPRQLLRRRAFLYAYGEGDAPTASGTLWWRGVCMTDAKLRSDGVTWQISIASLYTLIKQDLGADLDEEVGPRGVAYNSHNPLVIGIGESASASDTGVVSVGVSFRIPEDTGTEWFAGNPELCAHINTEFASRLGALSNTYRAVPNGNDDWRIECTISTGTPRFPYVAFISRVDGGNGATYHWGAGITGSQIDIATGLPIAGSVAGGAVIITTPDPMTSVPGERTVPRGYWSRNSSDGYDVAAYNFTSTPPDPATYPPERIYVGGALTVGVLDAVDLEFESGWSSTQPIGSQSAANRSITTGRYRAAAAVLPSTFAYTRDHRLSMRFVRSYATGSLSDFRDALVSTTTGAPVYANRGFFPKVTDAELASWTTAVSEAARGRSFATNRRFVSYRGVKLDEFIAHHCMLLGLYPALDSSGKITLRRLRLPAPTETPDATLDGRARASDGLPTWERNARGVISEMTVRTGYNAREDDFEGVSYHARDVDSVSRVRGTTLVVEPRSENQTVYPSHGPSASDVVDLAAPLLGIFGGGYAVVTAGVPFDFFNVLIGDTVKVDLPHIPNLTTGGRGEVKNGIVISRRWELDRGVGSMSILFSTRNIAGYTPSVTITKSVFVSGTTYDLTVTSNDPNAVEDWFKPGDTISGAFEDGMAVIKGQWNTASPTTLTGTVVSTTDTGTSPATGNVRVTFSGAYTWASGDVLDYDSATAAVTAQEPYAFFAGTDGKISFLGGDEPAKVYAP